MALFTLKGLNRRRWELFKANRRGLWSLWIFGALFLMSVFAPIIANDRPMLVSYKGELLFPDLCQLSRIQVRRVPGAYGLPRSGEPG